MSNPSSHCSDHGQPQQAAQTPAQSTCRVRVIGVGGAGSNAVDRMEFDERVPVLKTVVNTDAQALSEATTADKVLLGRSLTRGLSTGGDPELGRKVAQKERELLEGLTAGQDLVFIVAGLGGGTGSAVAPAIAQMATAQGALVISFVTLPFMLEGQSRQQISQKALGDLRLTCDALLPLPNDLLLQHMQEDTTVVEAFRQADSWIARAVQSVSTMLLRTGTINLDLAALRTAFKAGGRTLFGLGRGQGADCVQEALSDLLICPLLSAPEHSGRADRLLLNIIGGRDLSLSAINRILETVTAHFGSREHTVLGAVIDERLEQSIELCVVGTTDIEGGSGRRRRPDVVPSRISGAAGAGTHGVHGRQGGQGTGRTGASTGFVPFSAPIDGDSFAAGAQSFATESAPDAAQDAAAAGDGYTADGYAAADTDGVQPDGATAEAGSGSVSGSVSGSGSAWGGGHGDSFSQSMIPGTYEDHASADGSDADGNRDDGSALFSRDEEFPGGGSRPQRPVHESKLKKRKNVDERARSELENQEEFLFVAEGEQRGIFEKSPRNIVDGVDLDVPTYLRRNLRIVLN